MELTQLRMGILQIFAIDKIEELGNALLDAVKKSDHAIIRGRATES